MTFVAPRRAAMGTRIYLDGVERLVRAVLTHAIAEFLGRTAAERVALFQFFNKSYDARSTIVHGGAAPKGLKAICRETQQRLRDAILASIDPRRDVNIAAIDAQLLT